MIAFNYRTLTVDLLLPVISVDSIRIFETEYKRQILSSILFLGVVAYSLYESNIQDTAAQMLTWLSILQKLGSSRGRKEVETPFSMGANVLA